MRSLYNKLNDDELKEVVKALLDDPVYKITKYTPMITSIASSKRPLSEKQRNVLIKHLAINEKEE